MLNAFSANIVSTIFVLRDHEYITDFRIGNGLGKHRQAGIHSLIATGAIAQVAGHIEVIASGTNGGNVISANIRIGQSRLRLITTLTDAGNIVVALGSNRFDLRGNRLMAIIAGYSNGLGASLGAGSFFGDLFCGRFFMRARRHIRLFGFRACVQLINRNTLLGRAVACKNLVAIIVLHQISGVCALCYNGGNTSTINGNRPRTIGIIRSLSPQMVATRGCCVEVSITHIEGERPTYFTGFQRNDLNDLRVQ